MDGIGKNQSAIPMEKQKLKIGLGFEHATGDKLGVPPSIAEESFRQSMMASINYGMLSFLEFGLYLPYYRDHDMITGAEVSGMGNVTTSFKFNYPPYPHQRGFELSYLFQVDIPTEDKVSNGFVRNAWHYNNEGAYRPYGNELPVYIMKLLTTANMGAIEGMVPLLFHFNFGLALGDPETSNVFLVGGGFDLTFNEFLAIYWAFDSEADVSASKKNIPYFEFPIQHSVGMQLGIPAANLNFTGGVSWAQNQADRNDFDYVSEGVPYFREADLEFFISMTYSASFAPSDSDHDEILDKHDRCPNESEDMDGFEDEDGCPELDNDLDGIRDFEDKCPNEPEDLDGFEDGDGCPDIDNDNDKILDKDDKCPNKAEDFDNFQDEDGCPELDNDLDGVLDVKDKCKNEPEDKDGYKDEDGCPDLDNDQDGVPDESDKCPDNAEIVNGYLDADGCPDEEPAYKKPSEKTKEKRDKRRRRRR